MLVDYYYPETIKGIIIAFSDMFNSIVVKNQTESGVKLIQVPCMFSPLEKYYLLRLKESAETPSAFNSAPIPRLGISLTGLSYDPDRHTGRDQTREFYDTALDLKDIDSFITDTQPVPYNFNFTLHVRTDSFSHFNQILENILPAFSPSLHLRVKEFSFLNIERNLQVLIEGVSPEFLEPQEEESVRYVNSDINFTVKGFMYKPISSAKVIKQITTNLHFRETGNDDVFAETFIISGGL